MLRKTLLPRYVLYGCVTGPGVQTASYTMGTVSFPGVKRPRRDVYRPSLSSTKIKEREELYFYSPSVASWRVISELYHYGVCKLVPYPKRHLMTNSEKHMSRNEEGTVEEKNTWLHSSILFFFFVALRPNAGHGLLIRQVSRSPTTTHHTR